MISRQALHSRTTLASEAIARVHRQTGHVRGLITKRYANNHTAVSFDSSTGVGVVTVTDVIRSVVLGMDIAYIRLPRVLQRVRKGGEHPIVPQRLNMHPNPMLFEDEIGHAESDKAGFYIYTPVSGMIEEINKALYENPALFHASDEEKGWLCKVRLQDPSELDGLLEEEASWDS